MKIKSFIINIILKSESQQSELKILRLVMEKNELECPLFVQRNFFLYTTYFWWHIMTREGNVKMSHQDQDVKIFFQPAIKIFQIYFTQHDI